MTYKVVNCKVDIRLKDVHVQGRSLTAELRRAVHYLMPQIFKGELFIDVLYVSRAVYFCLDTKVCKLYNFLPKSKNLKDFI